MKTFPALFTGGRLGEDFMTLQGDGQEVLVLDADDEVCDGLRKLLTEIGLHPTIIDDSDRACDLAEQKYFSVALVDLDTPEPNRGLETVRRLREVSPATAVFMLSTRKVFEAAVAAFRAGAREIIVKAPEQVDLLRRRVVEAAQEVAQRNERDQLIEEVLMVHEEFLKRLMQSSRKTAELEEKLNGAANSPEGPCRLLLVESPGINPSHALVPMAQATLTAAHGYHLQIASSGGEAMDIASHGSFHIVLVSRSLPDLNGSMVVSALKNQHPELLAILYAPPDGGPGRAEVMEGSKVISFLPQFERMEELVSRVDELRAAFFAKSRERRYLATFRQQHYDLLQRFAELKQKLVHRRDSQLIELMDFEEL